MRAHYRKYERSAFSMNSTNDTSSICSNGGRQGFNHDKDSIDNKSSSSKRLVFRSNSKTSVISIKSNSSKVCRPSSLEKDLYSKRRARTDSLGIPINHFNKRIYRVSFVDELSAHPFAEVIEEKERETQNAQQEENAQKEKKDSEKDETQCKCIVF